MYCLNICYVRMEWEYRYHQDLLDSCVGWRMHRTTGFVACNLQLLNVQSLESFCKISVILPPDLWLWGVFMYVRPTFGVKGRCWGLAPWRAWCPAAPVSLLQSFCITQIIARFKIWSSLSSLGLSPAWCVRSNWGFRESIRNHLQRLWLKQTSGVSFRSL